jgi:hypothetical protein
LIADERVQAVAKLGFTDRQARFLTTVMLHGGVCVRRQFARFAGTAYGHNVNAFFDKLVERGHAASCDCVHNRAKLYHVHDRALYGAIGEANSRYRRPLPARAVCGRLMRLDAVIEHPELEWLPTEAEKLAFLADFVPSCRVIRLPNVTVGVGRRRRVRVFPDDVLIGVEPGGRVVFLCLVSDPFPDALRACLQRSRDLLRIVPVWTLKLVFPARISNSIDRFVAVAREELATPLPVVVVDELREYFGHLAARAKGQTRGFDPRFRELQETFAAPRFRLLYRRWLADGETAFETVTSPAIGEAIAWGGGRIEWTVLPTRYDHLSPLASLVRPGLKGVEEGDVAGDTASPPPQPPPAYSISDPTSSERDWRRLVHDSQSG